MATSRSQIDHHPTPASKQPAFINEGGFVSSAESGFFPNMAGGGNPLDWRQFK
jgi:hypothetical protein